MRVIYIKNDDTNPHTYSGQELSPSQYYLIQEIELLSWRSSSVLLTDISNGIALVAKSDDGNGDILDVNEAIDYLKGTDQVDRYDKDGHKIIVARKSYKEASKSFTTPDYSQRRTWFGDYTRITDEVMDTSDNTIYTSTRTPTAGWSHSWICWSDIPNHVRQSDPSNMKIEVKKNDVLETTGFTIDYDSGTITFDSANIGTDTIKVSYAYANSSQFDLMAETGKTLQLDYVEVQFSEGSTIPDGEVMLFESIYNGPAIPAYGFPADTDIVLKTFEYHGYRDFLNESTQALTCEPFMGMVKKAIILPWNYLTGHTIVPVGQVADLDNKEFHKLRCRMKNDDVIGNSEIATGTFYCLIGPYNA